MNSHNHSNKFIGFLALAGILVSLNLFVYSPALHHVSRADNESFLAELYSIDNFKDELAMAYSYPRKRTLSPGDSSYFHPLSLIILALEKQIFGTHFIWWQALSLLLHICVCFQLLRLLKFFDQHLLGFFAVVHFSLLHFTQEMVIWQHVVGYLIVCLLILKALEHMMKYFESKHKDATQLWKISTLLLFANFFLEFGLICNTIIFLFVIHHRVFQREKDNAQKLKISDLKLFTLLIPLLIYLGANLMDALMHETHLSLAKEHIQLSLTMKNFLTLLGFSLTAPFLPALLHLSVAPRVKISSFSIPELLNRWEPSSLTSNLNMLIILLAIFFISLLILQMLLKRLSPEKIPLRNESYLAWCSLTISLSYLLMITLARFNTRGLPYMQISLYHFYPIILFLTVFVYFFIHSLQRQHRSKILIFSAILILVLSTSLNAFKNYSLNKKLADHTKPIHKVRRLIGAKPFYLSKKLTIQAEALIVNQNFQMALNKLNRSIELNPYNSFAYYDPGAIYFNLKHYEQAMEDFNKAIDLNPAARILINRGSLFGILKQYDEAIRDFSHAIKLEPDYVLAYPNRALCYIHQNKFPEAITDYSQAIKLDPDNGRHYLNRARLFFLMKEHEKAKTDIQKAQALNIDVTDQFLHQL